MTDKKYYMGCLMPSKGRLNLMPTVIKPDLIGLGIPTKVDLTEKFPYPGQQGTQNSCVGWAVAYAYKSFQEKLDHNWDVHTLSHEFSPAYVYNQINGGRDEGAYIDTAMQLLMKQGVCSLAVMPYNDDDYTTQPNVVQKQVAAQYKSFSWGVLDQGSVSSMKNHLAGGDAVVVGIPIYPDFDDISSSNPIYDDASGKLRGYHAICLAGYDDARSAFKLINSWGTGWGLSGYGYISYNLIEQFETVGYVMQDIDS